jgi:glutamate synthase domain-containing protein 2
MRLAFYITSVSGLVLIFVGGILWPPTFYLLIFALPLVVLGLFDIFISTSNVLRNYPVLGHLRYMLEFVSPEIQQYFIETPQSGRPFNREQRALIYRRAKGVSDTTPFGTVYDLDDDGAEFAFHSLAPKHVPDSFGRITVGGPQCTKPYDASRLNISAMSFGALSSNAIEALNKGARRGGFAHNTGEGGLSPYHLKHGGDIIWQIGTGYFGCRTADGRFDDDAFVEGATLDVVKMIELKLSQGAKPSHGGLLPGEKVSAEIARIRLIEQGVDCLSPPAHPEFSSPLGLLEFVDRLRSLSGGKPVGFKLCIGVRSEFMSICKAMLETGILPDFITVDGAEGGTGAAPPEFSDSLGTPINEALVFVHSCLVGIGLRDKIRIIASGKVATGFDIVTKIALGADMCNVARPMMFAVGCIQARRCNDNTCPTGVATQNTRRAHALDVDTKHVRVANYHDATIRCFLELSGAMGLDDPDQLTPSHIFRRVNDGPAQTFAELYEFIAPNALKEERPQPGEHATAWAAASADRF